MDIASQFSRDDPVARLIVHYFYPCDFMRRDYQRVKRALARQKQRTRWRVSQELCYARLWLSMLYAVVEGFEALKLNDPRVASLLEDGAYERLKRLRNGTFHYQKSHEKLSQFYSDGGIGFAWAENLHEALDHFFRNYRMDMTVKNLLAMTKPEGPAE